MLHDAVLVAGKDLRIEARSRVALWQVVPFAVLVLVLLAFAIGPDQASLRHAAPGIFWVALLFSTVLAIQRSVAVESGEGTRDGLRLSGIDPAGIFLGKAAAIGLQLLALQLVLWAGVTLPLRRARARDLARRGRLSSCHRRPRLRRRALRRTFGGAAGARHTAAAARSARAGPVLLAGSKVWQAALDSNVSSGTQWLKILVPFAVDVSRRGHRPLRAAAGGGMSTVNTSGTSRPGRPGAPVARRRRRSAAVVTTALHRLAGAVGHPAGRGARQSGSAALHPSRGRHGRALLGRRRRAGGQPPLSVAPDAFVLLGPAGRLGRRGRRGVLCA